jgi:hypothetical protein
MAACVFRDPKQIEALSEAAHRCRTMNHINAEFKYAKTKDRVKDCFFACTSHVDYKVRTIVIQKDRIYSTKLRSSPSALKSFAISQLLSHGFGYIQDAKVVIDGQDTKAFGISDTQYVARMANSAASGTIRKVEFADSRQNVGIQLADMVAGAINRGVRTHKPADDRHLRLVHPRTYQPHGTFWMFK